ncbi:MAG: ornithine cyclodeaminase [Acidimicrobiia bacterium]|nr:ornithine cyclodeaminase [Acidimicrobiia bacterium]
MGMLVISPEEALELFDYRPLIDFFESQHHLPPARVNDLFAEDGTGNLLLARVGSQPGTGLGVKLATVFPANRDLPTVNTVYVLFDPMTGEEQAAITGNALTWFKTACDSALASSYLADRNARTMLMVGAGAMAPHLIRAHTATCPSIKKIRIWNRTQARAEVLASELGEDLPTGVTDLGIATDLAEAVQEADLISCATMTVEPLIRGEWLSPGTHLDLVGSYRPHMREVDDAAIARSRIYVDLRATALDTGEIRLPIDSRVITTDDLIGDLFQLVSGDVPARRSDQEITLFKNAGGGHLDLMAARFLLAAKSRADLNR